MTKKNNKTRLTIKFPLKIELSTPTLSAEWWPDHMVTEEEILFSKNLRQLNQDHEFIERQSIDPINEDNIEWKNWIENQYSLFYTERRKIMKNESKGETEVSESVQSSTPQCTLS